LRLAVKMLAGNMDNELVDFPSRIAELRAPTAGFVDAALESALEQFAAEYGNVEKWEPPTSAGIRLRELEGR
jgi:hypothetical protein